MQRELVLNYRGEDRKPTHSSVSKNLYLLHSYPDYGFNVFIWYISTSASYKQDNTKLILHLSYTELALFMLELVLSQLFCYSSDTGYK